MKIPGIALCVALLVPAAATAEMRILSVEPSLLAPGDTAWIYGRDLGGPNGKAVQLVRIDGREPHFYPVRIITWERDRIYVQIPWRLPESDQYGIRVYMPGRPVASDRVRVTIRNVPPARAADSAQVVVNRCERRARRTSGADDRFERSTGSLAEPCANPILRITTRNSVVEPRYHFYLNGDFGGPRGDLELALMDERNGAYELVRLVRAARWSPRVIEFEVPDMRPGDYAFGLVYRLPAQPRTRPLFEHASNTIMLRFER
jgi:hypothetical protein